MVAIYAVIVLWLKGRDLPPVIVVLALTVITIALMISVAVILQVVENSDGNVGWCFVFLPLAYIISAISLIIRITKEESHHAVNRTYRNKILGYLNRLMAATQWQPVWVIILLIPVFIVITVILILCGQDSHALTRVFTETTGWHFSQKAHPPFLDHQGHYLCTVAACGNPDLVKPIRLGNRHGHQIIVNRQLQIANAFEELIQDISPVFHRYIRRLYDQYGYPLSKRINTPMRSNIIYLLMKPVEWFFVLVLYTCVKKPEMKIAKQYT